MKTFYSLLIILSTSFTVFSQVGINTTAPNASAMLDISSSDKGVLVPRVALINVSITTLDGSNLAATGLLIYNTNASVVGGNGIGFYVFNGSIWEKITTSADQNEDADFFEEGTTNAPDDIADDIYTQGNVAIGKTSADYPLDIETEESRGVNILLSGTTNATLYGDFKQITNTGNGNHIGSYNNLNGIADGDQTTVFNFLSVIGTGNHTGVVNRIQGNSTGFRRGISNEMNNSGNGRVYGTYNSVIGSGSGSKYGSFNIIDFNSGGTHYGVYSSVLKSGSFAGYFLGNVSIGTSATNSYVLPATRGALNQIMQTDALGNVSWIDPSSIVSNDVDFYLENTTNGPNDITDDIYTLGNLAIGKTVADYPLDVASTNQRTISTSLIGNNNSDYSNMFNRTISNGTGTLTGVTNSVGGTGNGNQRGTYNILSGSGTGSKTAVRNQINANSSTAVYAMQSDVSVTGNASVYGVSTTLSSSGTGNQLGTHNVFVASGNGDKYGVANYFIDSSDGTIFGLRTENQNNGNGIHYGTFNSITGTGSGTKYGNRTLIAPTAGGDLYGVYSEVLRSTGISYAGYFLGDVAIGTTAANTYTFPDSRGTINQIMQSDGFGNVFWVNPDTVASVINANNGLNLNGTNAQLGGNLNQNTTISLGANSFEIDLNGSGGFAINDQGVPHFEMAISGISSFGDDTLWRDGNSTSGTLLAQISDDANDGRFRVYENGIASVDLDANSQFVFNEQGFDRNFRIESNNQTNMFLVDASTDRIGIKENLPLADIHLKQSSLIEAGPGGMIFESSLNSNYWKIYHSGSHFSFVENGVRRAYVEAATGNYVITSDKRLKKNIEILSSVSDKLKNIGLYRFHYINQNNSDKKLIGVMAQELQQHFPELVSINEEGNLGVSYDGLSAVAIKAIKEQQEEIEKLNLQLVAQQKEIDAIKQFLKL